MSFRNYSGMIDEIRSQPLEPTLYHKIHNTALSVDEIIFYFNILCMPPKYLSHEISGYHDMGQLNKTRRRRI